ncbi:MAG: sigma-54 dependent transcriptional regulator [Thermoguttaceae bacterium]|nr:sigma-54 dependent transcriptional regulator [Thermoguttaceae bacterium]MDW8037255.1 sigma-54 dependent transcriptional regulator [Thermoguttaceae bacterium]
MNSLTYCQGMNPKGSTLSCAKLPETEKQPAPLPQEACVGTVLVVDDHQQSRESMADILRQAGHTVDCCSSAAEALQQIERRDYDCIVTDLKMPGMSGLELILQLEARRYPAQVVMVTAYGTVASAVEAMRHGAFDYIEKPFDVDRLEQMVSKAIFHRRVREGGFISGAGTGRSDPPVMVGISTAIQKLRARIAQVAETSETVLITGESGTGKELVARAIHATSPRRLCPFVSVNCPALSAHLMESELFGHEKGAFTGADTVRMGRFELAHTGTLLLDEVTEIELPLQAKLLRVLQERCFERVGSSKPIYVDVRLLATTNRNLPEEVAKGRFREDLYYRLNVVPIHVPPLRQRREDIPVLVDYFLQRMSRRLGRPACQLAPQAIDLMMRYDWPGNVRELENIITRASVLYPGQTVSADEIRRWLIAPGDPMPPELAAAVSGDMHGEDCPGPMGEKGLAGSIPVGISLQEMERRLIEATLEHFGGHRAKTAQALGIGLRTLTSKLRQYGYAPREKSYRKAS